MNGKAKQEKFIIDSSSASDFHFGDDVVFSLYLSPIAVHSSLEVSPMSSWSTSFSVIFGRPLLGHSSGINQEFLGH